MFTGCFSGIEEVNCKTNNTNSAQDLIFWAKKCTKISEICSMKGLEGKNASFCLNGTSLVPISQVINRTLASEEYYK